LTTYRTTELELKTGHIWGIRNLKKNPSHPGISQWMILWHIWTTADVLLLRCLIKAVTFTVETSENRHITEYHIDIYITC